MGLQTETRSEKERGGHMSMVGEKKQGQELGRRLIRIKKDRIVYTECNAREQGELEPVLTSSG